MYKKESELIFQRYRLITEGIKDIQAALLPFKDEEWYEYAYNTLSMRTGDAVLMLRRQDAAMILPPAWTGNEKDKPLFTDADAKHCVEWFKAGTGGNDILQKYIDYKRYNMQQTAPLTQFADFVAFDRFVDAQKREREDTSKTREANKAAQWLPEDIVFENDDVVILNGYDRYSNIRIRAVLAARTGITYNFCISNPTLATNFYDTYRFREHGKSQSFYWLFFKNIPVGDRFHICVLGVRKDGTYDWSLKDNNTAEVTWGAFINKYRSYGVDLDKPIKDTNGTIVHNVKEFLKWNELTEEEQRDKSFRDLVVDKLKINYNANAYDITALQNLMRSYTTQYERRLISDALQVVHIDGAAWAALNPYCRNIIINRIPPESLREDVIESDAFKSDTKTVHRYCEMLTRSVKYLDNYLLDIMSTDQVDNQVRNVWQHNHDAQLQALNLPTWYPSHFSPKLLAEHLAVVSAESNYVKRPENWSAIAEDARVRLFNYINTSANTFTQISDDVLNQSKEAFASLPHIWTPSLLADYYMYVALSNNYITPEAWGSMDTDEKLKLCYTLQRNTNKNVDIDDNLLQKSRECFINKPNIWSPRTLQYAVTQKHLAQQQVDWSRINVSQRKTIFDDILSNNLTKISGKIENKIVQAARDAFIKAKVLS